MWKINKSIAKEVLPTQPVDFPIEPWWAVCLVNLSLEEFKKLSEEEMTMIDKVCKEEANSYILFYPEIIKGLYQRGLIYFDVPVYPDDRITGLKSHVVTLYEAGKLGHASIADLCKDLSTLEGARFEGELQEFANHASSLCCVLLCLLSGGASVKAEDETSKKISNTSVQNDEVISMTTKADKSVPLGSNESGPSGDNADAVTDSLESDGRTSFVLNEDCVVNAEPYTGDVKSELASETLVIDSQNRSKNSESEVKPKHDGEIIDSLDSEAGKKDTRKKRIYRVDILRCESLATLAPATLERLLNRDYHIVLSMIPLPSSSILPGATGPVHLGPPTHSSMTPWMKLVLYTATRNGPLSVVLMKGQCLRLLPAPLAGCEKALIWSWDGATIGGLGGKFEGNLVSGGILLHCLNSLLRHSAVLVQPLSKQDLDKSGKAITIDIPLPLRNSDGSIVNVGEELGLGLVEGRKLNSLLSDLANMIDLWNIGYIRLIKLCTERNSTHFSQDEDRYEWFPLSVEFGIPLFSPKLCRSICNRIISSQLLQTDSFHQHHEAMQGLRKRLRDMCAEYHATGPCAKLLYQKERSKESFKHQMTYASGRWNPLVDPSSPISVAPGDYQRRKLAMRQRSCREILSFDGSILRSYALSPIYECELRPIDESLPVTTQKPESDDADSKEVVLPGVNLLYDGSELHPFDICACLQARQTVSLVAEASAASEVFTVK